MIEENFGLSRARDEVKQILKCMARLAEIGMSTEIVLEIYFMSQKELSSAR